MKLFPSGPWKGVVSSASAQANCLIEYYILIIIWRHIGPMTLSNNFVFVPNRLPNQFARPPEMTLALPAKIGPTEGGMGVLSAILSFLDNRYFHL